MKLLGLTVSNNLKWNEHINANKANKANKRMYFLIQLKRAMVPVVDLKSFYITCIRSVLDYGVPVFHYALPKYLMKDLESKKGPCQLYVHFLIMTLPYNHWELNDCTPTINESV